MNQRSVSAVPVRPTGAMPSNLSLYSAAANILKQSKEQNPEKIGRSTSKETSTSQGFSSAPSYAVVRFSLISTTEFTATASGPVNKSVVEAMKKTKGVRYDAEKKRVVFPLQVHDSLQVTLASLRVGVEPLVRSTIAGVTLQQSRNQMSTSDSAALLSGRLNSRLLESLADFQREGAAFILRNDGRVLLADEMGLGKTRQAIAAAVMYREDWPVLVICPSSARHHWLHEARALMCPEVVAPEEISLIDSHHYSYSPVHQVLIVSYSIVQRLSSALHAINFNVTIADESHFLKNIKTQRSQSLLPLLRKSKRAILISGTPALSRPMELYTQLHVLAPHIWPDEKEFARRYCQSGGGKGACSWADGRDSSNTHELFVMLSSTVMLRRLKKDVMKHLPPKVRRVVRLTLSDAALRDKFRDIFATMRHHDSVIASAHGSKRQRAEEIPGVGAGAEQDVESAKRKNKMCLLELFSQSGVAKVQPFLEHLAKFLDDPFSGKLLVFAHHRTVLDAIERFVLSRRHQLIRIDGQTASKERYTEVSRFQNTPGCRVAVLAITAAGVAISLTAASTVYFAELFWTPGSLVQAEDRVHRIGQSAGVEVSYFLCEGTVDDVLWPMLHKKMRVLGEVVEGQATDEFVSSATVSEAATPLDRVFLSDIEELVMEIVQEEDIAMKKVKSDDFDDYDDGPAADPFLCSSGHSESTLSISAHSDSVGRVHCQSEHAHQEPTELDWLDDFIEMDPIASVFVNSSAGQIDSADELSFSPSFGRPRRPM